MKESWKELSNSSNPFRPTSEERWEITNKEKQEYDRNSFLTHFPNTVDIFGKPLRGVADCHLATAPPLSRTPFVSNGLLELAMMNLEMRYK